MSQGFDTAKPKLLDPLTSNPMRLNFTALATHHAGPTAPPDPQQGWVWMDTSNPTSISLKAFISNAWVVILANIQAGPPSQSNVDKFVHIQSTPSMAWIINHTMNTTGLTFTVYDATGLWMLPNSVQLVSNSQVVITFLSDQSGTAVLTG